MYALTSIKLAGGEETPRFEAKIVKLEANGKTRHVATVANGGFGGCCDYHWPDRSEEPRFKAWIAEQRPGETFEPEDGWVYAQLDAFELERKLMRWSATKTVFTVEGDKEGEYRLLDARYHGPYSPAGVYIRERFAGKAKVFVRETKTWEAL